MEVSTHVVSPGADQDALHQEHILHEERGRSDGIRRPGKLTGPPPTPLGLGSDRRGDL